MPNPALSCGGVFMVGNGAINAPLFRLRNVGRVWRDRTALEGVSLDISQGEVVVLGGPSGSGKSTMLSILSGAMRPSTGEVLVEGTSMNDWTPKGLRRHRARCSNIHQSVTLVPQLNVHDNVVAGLLPTWSWYQALAAALFPVERHKVREILDDLEIGDRQWDFTTQLSSGQQQRVTIARGLISRQPIILADEPTSALDPATAKQVTRLIFERARSSNATLIFCTHWLELGLEGSDRLIGLRGGKVLIDTPAAGVTGDALDYLYEGTRERVQ